MGLRRTSIAFLLVTCFFYLAQYTYAPFLTPYVGVLGGSLTMTGLVAGSYGLLQALLRVPLGLWSDRRGRRKPFVLAGALLAAVSAFGLARSATPLELLIFRSLSGVAASTWVLYTVFYAGLFPPEEAGKGMGLLTFAASAGQWFGNLLGGFLAERGGWTAPFYGAVVPGVLGFLLALSIPDTAAAGSEAARAELAAGDGATEGSGAGVAPAGRGEPAAGETHGAAGAGLGAALRQCARRGVVEPAFLAILTHFVFYATVLGFTPVYVMSIGLSKLTLGMLATASGAAYVLGTLLTTRAESRKTPWRLWVGGSFALMALSVLATPALRSPWQLAAVFVTLGLCRGTTYPSLMAVVVRESPACYAATSMGFFQAVYAIGMFAGPALAGVVAQRWGLTAVFPFSAALAAVGLAWCSLARPGLRMQEVQ